MLNAEAEIGGRTISGSFFNLIPSRFPPVGLYDRLTDDKELKDAFAEIEQVTNPRLRAIQQLKVVPKKGTKTSQPYQNWNHAPYAYGNPDGSTFFGSHLPVVELFGDKQTALAVAIARREAFLRATDQPNQGVELRMFKRSVRGTYADAPFDPSSADRDQRWQFGESVAKRGLDGVLFNPSERPCGQACAVLDKELLGKTVQCEHYRCTWDGKKIRAIYVFERSEVIDASLLGSDNNILE